MDISANGFQRKSDPDKRGDLAQITNSFEGTITQYVQGVGFEQKDFSLIVVLVLLSTLARAKTLTVWITGHSNEELNIMKEMIDEQFSPKFGVEVAVTGLSWADNESKYLLAAASGDVPDVGSTGGLFLPELGLRGALVNLTDFPDFEEVRKRAPEGFYRSLTYDSLVSCTVFLFAYRCLLQR